jgi:hypothetical protein
LTPPLRPSSSVTACPEPKPLTIVERTMISFALGRLRGLASDIALAGALPLLALELSLRTLRRRRMLRPSATT